MVLFPIRMAINGNVGSSETAPASCKISPKLLKYCHEKMLEISNWCMAFMCLKLKFKMWMEKSPGTEF